MINKESVKDARQLYYSLLSRLFVFSYSDERFSGVKETMSVMATSPLDELSKDALEHVVDKFDTSKLIEEYDDIFHAPPTPVRVTISYYSEGYESGEAHAKVKKLLSKTKLRKDDSKYVENEDNFGFLFTLMSQFIDDETLCTEIFTEFINPYVDEFIANVYTHDSSDVYKEIAIILRSFMEFERAYYGVSKPVDSKNIQVYGGLSRSERARRELNKQKRSRGSRDGFEKKKLSETGSDGSSRGSSSIDCFECS
ncbi:MAG: dehydrogenase [Campylobacteraceae bacterium]|nr:dehydrogenase [Campylobacteraceae bacterium]